MLADAKKLLKRLNIPLTDENFIQISELLKDNNKLYFMFCHFFYVKQVPITELVELFNLLQTFNNLNQLPKDLITYRDINVLYEDLDNLEKQTAVKKFCNSLSADLENKVVKQFDNLKKMKDELIDKTIDNFEKKEKQLDNAEKFCEKLTKAILEFYNLKTEYQSDFFRNSSRIHDVRSLSSELIMYNKMVKSGKDFVTIKNTINEHYGLKKVFENDEILLCEAVEFSTIREVGTTSWCIARDTSHWQSYITSRKGGKQYVLWNSKVQMSNPDYQIAFTVVQNENVSASYPIKYLISATHNRRNDALDFKTYLSQYGLSYIFDHLTYKTNVEKLIDILNFFETYPRKKIKDERFHKIELHSKENIKELLQRDTFEKFKAYKPDNILKLYDSNSFNQSIAFYYATMTFLTESKEFWTFFLQNFRKILTYTRQNVTVVQLLKEVLREYYKRKINAVEMNLYSVAMKKYTSLIKENVFENIPDEFWLDLSYETLNFLTTNEKILNETIVYETFNRFKDLKGRTANERNCITNIITLLKSHSKFKADFSKEETKSSLSLIDSFWKASEKLWSVKTKKEESPEEVMDAIKLWEKLKNV